MKIAEINWGYSVPNEGIINLLLGERPETPQLVQEAIQAEAGKANQYPLANNAELYELLARKLKIQPKNLFLTNGSDDAIECVARIFLSPSDEVLVPTPSFPTYATVSQMLGAQVKKFSLFSDNRKRCLTTKEIEEKLSELLVGKPKIVWLANPNNPTGNTLLSRIQIKKLVKRFSSTLFVIDECYAEFAKQTATSLIAELDNVLVIGSFSKSFGLAGLRFGYIAVNAQVIDSLNRFLSIQPFRVNRFAQAAALKLLKNPQEMKAIVESFQIEKRQFELRLKEIKQLKVWPTLTSFSFCELQNTQLTATQVTQELAKKGILIKDCSLYGSIDNKFIRLGIPKKEDQLKVIAVLKEVINSE